MIYQSINQLFGAITYRVVRAFISSVVIIMMKRSDFKPYSLSKCILKDSKGMFFFSLLLHNIAITYSAVRALIFSVVIIMMKRIVFGLFLGAKLLYKSLCPSVRLSVPLSLTLFEIPFRILQQIALHKNLFNKMLILHKGPSIFIFKGYPPPHTH